MIEHLFIIKVGETAGLILDPVLTVFIYSRNPRFILSIRELYVQNVHGEGIDGFGIGHGVTTTNIGTVLHFVDVELEEIPLEVQR